MILCYDCYGYAWLYLPCYERSILSMIASGRCGFLFLIWVHIVETYRCTILLYHNLADRDCTLTKVLNISIYSSTHWFLFLKKNYFLIISKQQKVRWQLLVAWPIPTPMMHNNPTASNLAGIRFLFGFHILWLPLTSRVIVLSTKYSWLLCDNAIGSTKPHVC